MSERSAFGGGDQRYLRDVQYGTTEKLDARSRLHRTYGTAPVPFATFEARLIEWPAQAAVLECGCGTGAFWTNSELPTTMSMTLTDLSPGTVDAAVATARRHRFDNDLIVDDPTAVLDYALSFPPGETATGHERRRLATAITDRFDGGRLRIHTRAGAFVARTPRNTP